MSINKIKAKNTLKWVIELGIWFLILIILANFILFLKSRHDKQYNSYQIFMPDVDGVIVGSPVNMMGVPIGYVEKIKIIDNEVFVRFTLDKKGLKLPKGSIVTVEFNGLGGSKSLEVYPPNEDSKTREEYLIVEEPKRLGSVVGLVDEMFDKVSSITYRISYFAQETSGTNTNKDDEEEKDIEKVLKQTNLKLDETSKKLENFNNKLNK